MNIGFDAKRIFNNFTGLGNYGRTLLRNLNKYYPQYNYHLYSPRIRRNGETEDFFVNPEFKIRNSLSCFKQYWRSFSIKSDFKKDSIGLYHGLSNEIPVGMKKTSTKSVVTIHDLIFKVYPGTYPAIDRKIYDLKFGYACRNADIVIAISESTKRDIIYYYDIAPEKIKVVYQSVNPLFYHLQTSERIGKIAGRYGLPDEYMLYVGSITARKNIKTLLKAYAILSDSVRIPLVLVGKGHDYKKECKHLARELNIYKYLHWIDSVDDNRHIQALLQKAKLVVYPSLYEGFGLPVVEAVLSETPVITSRVSSLPEALGCPHLLADPENIEEWECLISKVLSDEEFRKSSMDHSRKYVAHTFDPEKLTHQMMVIYKKMLSYEK